MGIPVSSQDYLGLLRFYAGQAHAIDSGDATSWARTFTPDGTFISPSAGGAVTGEDELTRFARQYAPDPNQPGRVYRHWISQLEAFDEADGTVVATCYGMLVGIEFDGVPRPLRTSVHKDTLVRGEQGWRIRSRVIIPDQAGADGYQRSRERGSR